jgi:hypothetical protein
MRGSGLERPAAEGESPVRALSSFSIDTQVPRDT